MDKNKLRFISYILIFCVVIVAAGGFYLGTFFGDDFSYLRVSNENKENEQAKPIKDETSEKLRTELLNVVELLNYSDGFVLKKDVKELSSYIMEKLYGGNYQTLKKYKVMNNNEYQKYRMYFNITLDNVTEDLTNIAVYLNNGFRIGYNIEKVNDKKMLYNLEYIRRSNSEYIYQIVGTYGEEKIVIDLNVTLISGHIYYNSMDIKAL